MLIADPVVLPTSNNKAAVPFEMLYSAFPMITWMQPRNNWRAMVVTRKYLTVQFAEELAPLLGCAVERDLPGPEFLADALRSPPMYFETENNAHRGICCVCYKGGCLGRCPNPSCGLLMHYTCVTPSKSGLLCPVCCVEIKIKEEFSPQDFPYWHEAEVGAPARRLKTMRGAATDRTSQQGGEEKDARPERTPFEPMEGKVPFPVDRWPTREEANVYGYETVKDWYLDIRRRGMEMDLDKRNEYEAEFRELQQKGPPAAAMGDDVAMVRESVACTCEAERLASIWAPKIPLGTAETGPGLTKPGAFVDVGPRAEKRLQQHAELKRALAEAVAARWKEDTTGPPKELSSALEASVLEYRPNLLKAQGLCKELQPQIEALVKLLKATQRQSVADAEVVARDYRLNPVDGVLERSVFVQGAKLWVAVMPTTVIPAELFSRSGQDVTWRRNAFETAHLSFLEPHRPQGATWQCLKRMAFWRNMKQDFEIWMHECAVCQQFRSAGVLAPMRSTLASIEGLDKIPWADVIIDCQGPFTKSARGNCYTVSYHCTLLGICKVEPFARLRKEDFLIALVTCVMRARRIPDIVRTDRGPEMTSAIMEEFLTLCNVKQFLGAAFTPRHQGPGERNRSGWC